MLNVTPSDISVIIQGNIRSETRQSVRSVRRCLPGAEVIVSTWEGENTSELEIDQVVFGPDPGAAGYVRVYPQKQYNNVNRKIVSARNGLCKASRRYCLIIRSDMVLSSDRFRLYYNRFGDITSPRTLFQQRMMMGGLPARLDQLFCMGDWWTFGLCEDTLQLYDIPLNSENRGEEFFFLEKNQSLKPYLSEIVCRFPPEQEIVVSFLRKHEKFECEHFLDITEQNLEIYRRFVYHSLICIESALSGVRRINTASFQFGTTLYSWYRQCRKIVEMPRLPLPAQFHGVYETVSARLEDRYRDIENRVALLQSDAEIETRIAFKEFRPVDQNQITFVVSGLAARKKPFGITGCLKSIRKYFPKSPIILSIWNDADLSGLESLYDEAVFHDRNDAVMLYSTFLSEMEYKLNSTNGQQLCVHDGLKRVKTPYAVRMRTDFILTGDEFLRLYNRWNLVMNQTDTRYQLFGQRVLVPSYVTRDSRYCKGDFVYQLSDLFNFGLTEDLLKLWDGVQVGRDIQNYFEDHPASLIPNPIRFNHLFTAEQYFFLGCIRNAGIDVQMPAYYLDHSKDEFVFELEKVYASNCLIASFETLGLQSKFNTLISAQDGQFLSLERLIELYLINIDPGNQECLAYLKTKLKRQNTIKRAITWSIQKTRCLILSRMKKGLRVFSPSYRVTCQTREMLAQSMEMERAGFDRLESQLQQERQSRPGPFRDRGEAQIAAGNHELGSFLPAGETKNQRILIIDSGYGDIGSYLLSLGANISFLERRKECSEVLKNKFPGRDVRRISGASWPYPEETTFDLAINLGVDTYGDEEWTGECPKHIPWIIGLAHAEWWTRKSDGVVPVTLPEQFDQIGRKRGILRQSRLLLQGCGMKEPPLDMTIPELERMIRETGWGLRLILYHPGDAPEISLNALAQDRHWEAVVWYELKKEVKVSG